jgi:hypothetical protein
MIRYSLFQEFLLSIKLAAQASGGADTRNQTPDTRALVNDIIHITLLSEL